MQCGLKYLILLSLLGSCTYNYIEPSEAPETVSYEQDVQTIFDASCTFCHNGHISSPDLSADASYDALISGGYIDTVASSDSELILRMSDKHYGSTATTSEINLITKWIEQGAQNN